MPDNPAAGGHERADALVTGLVLIAVLIAVAVVTQAIGSLVLTRFVIRMFIDVVLVMGLQMFMGNTNILWFPHIGYMGIGAYASVLLSMTPIQKMLSLPDLYPVLAGISIPFLPAILAGAAFTAVVAAVSGLPLMRLSDFAAVIASFALLIVIHVVLTHWNQVTNGPQTLFGVARRTGLWNTAVWACLFIGIAVVFKESKAGLQLRASRDDLVAARAIGINITMVRWLALVLSAFAAGIAGGLFAHFITSFTPRAFFLSQTFVILAMLVIGGPATVTGGVVGTLLVTIVYQGLRWTENTLNVMQVFPGNIVGLTDFTLAVALIGMLILRPAGLVERHEVGRFVLSRLPSRRSLAAASRLGRMER